MHIASRLSVSALLYIFTTAVAFAHPGPHSHSSVTEGAWHDFIGWEFTLALFGIIAAWFLMRRMRNTRTQ